MKILRYETRLQQYRTAIVDDAFDVDAWKRRMVEDDIMTPKLAKSMSVTRVVEAA